MTTESTFDNGLRLDESLFAKARAADAVLHDVLGQSAGLVTAEWKLATQPRVAVRVVLHDPFAGDEEATFAPDELLNRNQLYWRLHRLWGDLLRKSSHVQLQSLREKQEAAGG